MRGDFRLIRIHLTLYGSAAFCFNELIWETALAYTTHTRAAAHSGISLSLAMLFSWQYYEATLSIHYKTLQETCWWDLQKIHRPGSILQTLDMLYIRKSKWQKRRREPSLYVFQMGTVTPNGRCDASDKGLTRHHPPLPRVSDVGAMSLQCSRGQCCITAKLSTGRRGESCGCKDHICLCDITNPI